MLLSFHWNAELCGPDWAVLMAVNSAKLLRMLGNDELDEVRYDGDGNATRHPLGPDDEEKLLKLLRDHSFPVRLDYSAQPTQQLRARCVSALNNAAAHRPLPRR